MKTASGARRIATLMLAALSLSGGGTTSRGRLGQSIRNLFPRRHRASRSRGVGTPGPTRRRKTHHRGENRTPPKLLALRRFVASAFPLAMQKAAGIAGGDLSFTVDRDLVRLSPGGKNHGTRGKGARTLCNIPLAGRETLPEREGVGTCATCLAVAEGVAWHRRMEALSSRGTA